MGLQCADVYALNVRCILPRKSVGVVRLSPITFPQPFGRSFTDLHAFKQETCSYRFRRISRPSDGQHQCSARREEDAWDGRMPSRGKGQLNVEARSPRPPSPEPIVNDSEAEILETVPPSLVSETVDSLVPLSLNLTEESRRFLLSPLEADFGPRSSRSYQRQTSLQWDGSAGSRRTARRLSSDEKDRKEKVGEWVRELLAMPPEQRRGSGAAEAMARGNLLLEDRHWLWAFVFDILEDEAQWELALQVLQNMRSQKWYTPHPRWHTKVILIMGIAEQPKEAEQLFRAMDCLPNTQAYNSLLKAFLRSKWISEAADLFEEMKRATEGRPNQRSYHIFLDFCVKSMDVEKAERLFQEMQMEGWKPDALSCNAMVFIYARRGPWEKMEAAATQLFASGFLPTSATWNALIGGFLSKGELSKVWSLIQSCRLSGHTLTNVTLTRLVFELSKVGQLAAAEQLFGSVLRRGVQLDLTSYNALISVYASRGAYAKMELVLKNMAAAGIQPDVLTLTSCLNGYLKANQLNMAEQTLLAMQARGFKPDLVMFAAVVSATGTAAKLRAVEQLIEKLGRDKGQSEEEIYAAMFEAFSAAQNMGPAGVLWGKLPDESDEEWPEPDAWRSVISGETEWETWHEFESALDRLAEAGFQPSVPLLNILLVAYFQARRPTRVLSIMQGMQRHGLQPDLTSFNILISHLGKERQVSAAESLMHLAQLKGCKLNVYTYNSMLDTYARVGLLERMEAMYESMKTADCTPDTVTFTTLMNGYGRQGNLVKLQAMYALSQEENCPPNRFTLEALSLGSAEYNRRMRKVRANSKRRARLAAAAKVESSGE